MAFFEAGSLLLESAAFRRLSAASASLLAERQSAGPTAGFVLAYQHAQGVRKLPREQSIETEHAWINTSLNRTAQADRNRILHASSI